MHKNFFWSKQNSKLKKTEKAWKEKFGEYAKILSFNIPQLMSKNGQRTCPYAGACADICYASQGFMAMPAAISARERNLEHINKLSSKELVAKLVYDIQEMEKITHIRIHDSGDFFSRDYYRSWIFVARQFPDVIFYAYTKSIPLIDWGMHPKNFQIVQSFGGKKDNQIDYRKPHSRIFVTHEERDRAGYCDGNDSDIPAILGERKIGLVYHGNKKLTDENIVQLRI